MFHVHPSTTERQALIEDYSTEIIVADNIKYRYGDESYRENQLKGAWLHAEEIVKDLEKIDAGIESINRGISDPCYNERKEIYAKAIASILLRSNPLIAEVLTQGIEIHNKKLTKV